MLFLALFLGAFFLPSKSRGPKVGDPSYESSGPKVGDTKKKKRAAGLRKILHCPCALLQPNLTPGLSPWLHDPPGHGVGVNDGHPELPQHVGHGALACGDATLEVWGN